MPRKSMKWEIVAVTAALTLIVLSSAFYIYYKVGVRRPLEKELAQIPDVMSVDISEDGGSLVITVLLSKVSDLSSAYARLDDVAKARAGEGKYRLVIRDLRCPSLEKVYRSIHYYLEEASARQNYGAMNEAVSDIISRTSLGSYQIAVTSDHIFVQLEQGDNYLYEILPQRQVLLGGASR